MLSFTLLFNFVSWKNLQGQLFPFLAFAVLLVVSVPTFSVFQLHSWLPVAVAPGRIIIIQFTYLSLTSQMIGHPLIIATSQLKELKKTPTIPYSISDFLASIVSKLLLSYSNEQSHPSSIYPSFLEWEESPSYKDALQTRLSS